MKADDLDKFLEDMERAAQQSFTGISKSAFFIQIWDKEFQKDPVALMQLAMAILLEKPFILMVPKGAKIPSKL